MADAWSRVLEKAQRAVVQIRNINVRNFDANPPASSMGTGFVVDLKLGLILTNRHVVTTAPSHPRALFYGDVEIPLKAFYCDPVHDFAFFKYDPALVKGVAVSALSLDARGAQRGAEICVLGSDAGERTMVLRGTIAQVDRNCPEYERGGGFSDHNTFYIAASCDTSGGSSGSPVIDKRGIAIGLNAGADMGAASSFFLPLDRVVYSLARIREWFILESDKRRPSLREFIPRGTVECVFETIPMSLCKRMGVTNEEEKWLRAAPTFNKGRDLLIVTDVLLQGPAAKAGLKRGDILLKVDHQCLTHFVELEAIMDESWKSRKPISMELKRGPSVIQVSLVASDAYRFIPDEYLEFGGGVFHSAGFANARDFGLTLDAVILDNSCYVFSSLADVPEDITLLEADGHPIRSVRDLLEALQNARGSSIMLRYCHNFAKSVNACTPIQVPGSLWHETVLATRNTEDFSEWILKRVDLSSKSSPSERSKAATPESSIQIGYEPSIMSRGLVLITFSSPIPLEGVSHSDFRGPGYVCDLARGLVLTDRNTVISTVGDTFVSFFATAQRLRASVVCLHPIHNMVLVRFDPSQLSNSQGLIEEYNFFESTDEGASEGEILDFIGFNTASHLIHSTGHKVTLVDRGTVDTTARPRFAVKSFEKIDLTPPLPATHIGGVLLDARGRVRAIASTLSIDDEENEASIINRVGPAVRIIDHYLRTSAESNRTYASLACDWNVLRFSRVTVGCGLSPEWAAKCLRAFDATGAERVLLAVGALMAGSRPARTLRTGDVLLELEASVVNGFADLDAACAASKKDSLKATILRAGKVLENVEVELEPLSSTGLQRLVCWHGMWIHATPDAVRWHGFLPSGNLNAFATCIQGGSPADRAGIGESFFWVSDVNGKTIHGVDDLLACPTDRALRVRIVGWQGLDAVFALEPDMLFWPTKELRMDPVSLEWSMTEYTNN